MNCRGKGLFFVLRNIGSYHMCPEITSSHKKYKICCKKSCKKIIDGIYILDIIRNHYINTALLEDSFFFKFVIFT